MAPPLTATLPQAQQTLDARWLWRRGLPALAAMMVVTTVSVYMVCEVAAGVLL